MAVANRVLEKRSQESRRKTGLRISSVAGSDHHLRRAGIIAARAQYARKLLIRLRVILGLQGEPFKTSASVRWSGVVTIGDALVSKTTNLQLSWLRPTPSIVDKDLGRGCPEVEYGTIFKIVVQPHHYATNRHT